MMKVFKLNDYEFFMAETLEQAIAECAKDYGMPEDELTDNPFELSDKDLDEYIFKDDINDANSSQRTFKEELQRRIAAGSGPQVFAVTEE